MKNALVYAVNQNQCYVDCMVNSINSFFANNSKQLTDTVHIFIVCTQENINLSKLNPEAHYTIIKKLSYDYQGINVDQSIIERLSYTSLFRLEIFHNPVFFDFDNVLYLDCDTVVCGDISELFSKTGKRISMALDCCNQGQKRGYDTPNYCNAGMILVRPLEIGFSTLNDIFNACIETLNKNKDLTFLDQDALNLILATESFGSLFKVVGTQFNAIWEDDKNIQGKILIRHYANSQGEYEKCYIDCLKIKNALVYCVNNNLKHIYKMVNSINSFYHFNSDIENDVQLFIISNESKLEFDHNLLHPRAKYFLVNDLSCNYSKLKLSNNPDWPQQIFFRYEMFVNKVFQEFDNVLYVDCDTQFEGSVSKLFSDGLNKSIYMIQENEKDKKTRAIQSKCKIYCNSGVILFKPKSLEESVKLAIFEELLNTNLKWKLEFPDQDALNFVFSLNKFKHLRGFIGHEYNCFQNTLTNWKTRNSKDVPCKIRHICRNEDYEKQFMNMYASKSSIKADYQPVYQDNGAAMKNALVYCVNDDPKYIKLMVNSANSFFHYNQKCLQDTELVIVSEKGFSLDQRMLYDGVRMRVVSDIQSSNYVSLLRGGWNPAVFLRYEIFANPYIQEFDNVLYLDCDTQFFGPVYDLFNDSRPLPIYMVEETFNHLKEQGFECNHYFNSGVILFKPKKMSGKSKANFYKELISIGKTKQLSFPDQDSLNMMFTTREFSKCIGKLDCKYNYSHATSPSGGVVGDAALMPQFCIRHFLGKKHSIMLRFLLDEQPPELRRIVVTMTSYPNRIGNCFSVVQSILNQTVEPDMVFLNLSLEEFPRGNKSIPSDLLDLSMKNAKFKINWIHGPNTKTMKKVFPILQYLDDDDIIMTVDDDFVYNKTLLASRLSDFKRNHCQNAVTTDYRYICSNNMFTKRMLNGYEMFLTDQIVNTYHDDKLYQDLLYLNGYNFIEGSDFNHSDKVNNSCTFDFKNNHIEKYGMTVNKQYADDKITHNLIVARAEFLFNDKWDRLFGKIKDLRKSLYQGKNMDDANNILNPLQLTPILAFDGQTTPVVNLYQGLLVNGIYNESKLLNELNGKSMMFMGSEIPYCMKSNVLCCGLGWRYLPTQKTRDFRGLVSVGNFVYTRGKLSREMVVRAGVHLPNDLPVGDNGLLASLLFKPGEQDEIDIGILVHQSASNKCSTYLQTARRVFPKKKIELLYMGAEDLDVQTLFNFISSCKMILSSSLEGIVFSHSFSVPALFFSDVCGYEFMDYYSIYGRIKYRQLSIGARFNEVLAKVEDKNFISSVNPTKEEVAKGQRGILNALPYKQCFNGHWRDLVNS